MAASDTEPPASPAKPAPKTDAKAAEAKPAAKPPAPEDKPFAEFVSSCLIPALTQEIASYGGPAVTLSLEQGPMPVVGAPAWMVTGELSAQRRFWLCFVRDDINSPKTIALAESGAEPSLLESFLIDEKKMTQALLVSRLVQRLNGQKWLGPN